MGSETEIDEIALLVAGDFFIGFFLNELNFELLPQFLEGAESFFFREGQFLDGEIFFDQLPHLLFDNSKVIGCERCVPQKIVEKSILCGRADTGLCPGK